VVIAHLWEALPMSWHLSGPTNWVEYPPLAFLLRQIEHVVLRGCLQRSHEGEQRRHAPLRRHPQHGLRFSDRREAGARRHPARGAHG
jgi:hypothetical protein